MTEPATNVAAMPALRESAPLARAVTQPMTPMEMLSTAIGNNAGIEVLEKLMALQERWEASQAKMAFNNAISDAKAEIKPIRKNRKVDFTSAKGRTNYDYEDLAEIARSVDPILAKYGLSYRHRSRQEGKKLSITCVLSHRAGHAEETELSADNDESGNKSHIQGVGSTATFLQRYTLKIALGLAAAKDDDGAAASASAKITEKQADELVELADEVGADKIAFCKYMKIQSFADLPANQFQKAVRALEAKRRKSGGTADAGH